MTTEAKPRIRWGILSTANIATKVARAIHLAEDADLIAVASRTKERAAAWGREHRVSTTYGTYDALLADDSLDAIYIPLPPSLHAEWTIKAAEHGKHVLCEKPLAANAAEAIAMADACRQNGVQLMDGVMWVHHDRTAAMKAENNRRHARRTAPSDSGVHFQLGYHSCGEYPYDEGIRGWKPR